MRLFALLAADISICRAVGCIFAWIAGNDPLDMSVRSRIIKGYGTANGLLIRGSQVQLAPGAPIQKVTILSDSVVI